MSELAPKLRYVADGERYIVMLGKERIGFVRRYHPASRVRRGRATVAPIWNAADTFMVKSRDFLTRRAAGEWLQKQAKRGET